MALQSAGTSTSARTSFSGMMVFHPSSHHAVHSAFQGIRVVPRPARGTILLSHPLQEAGFKRAAILLSSHKPALGSHGLALAWETEVGNPGLPFYPYSPAADSSDQVVALLH